VTIAELIACAKECFAAGVGGIHAHVRGEAGEHVLDAGLYKELIAAFDVVVRLCCTNRVRDSSRESSMVAEMHEQTHTADLQDHELACL
jgi:uncharacterized protein (DUF849 family)